jgi:hypothetical protein
VQLEGLVTYNDGVPRVVAAVEPDYHVRLGGVKVGHLPLALVPELGPYYHSDRHGNQTRIRSGVEMDIGGPVP